VGSNLYGCGHQNRVSFIRMVTKEEALGFVDAAAGAPAGGKGRKRKRPAAEEEEENE
jgi:hypothetical protein